MVILGGLLTFALRYGRYWHSPFGWITEMLKHKSGLTRLLTAYMVDRPTPSSVEPMGKREEINGM